MQDSLGILVPGARLERAVTVSNDDRGEFQWILLTISMSVIR
jgi:hypothetical protein